MADDNLIVLTEAEWREAAEARLADLGITYGELMARNRDGNPTHAERRLYVLIGGSL
jgi:hypothetical protein